MKRRLAFLALLPMLLLTSCGGFHMIEKTAKGEIKASSEKATLVIMRVTSFGFAVVMNAYVDGKYVGQTKGKCYYTVEVDPGERWIIGESENRAVAKMNFEAGKVYYLEQMVVMGMMKARTGWNPHDPAYFKEQLPELDHIGPAPDYVGEDMEADDLQEDKDNHEEEMKDDPERHRNTLEYVGF